MASRKVKEIAEEVIVEDRKPTVRKTTAGRRKAVVAPLEVAIIEVVLEVSPDVVEAAHLPLSIGKKAKVTKTKKPKLVRDSFTIPEVEYIQLAELKQRCLDAGLAVRKSELLRAGLQALVSMPSDILIKQFDSIEKLKTGRPSAKAE
ncbi:MAG: hypothetical protein K2Q15_16125 [Burkholderiales bacterium]|nr:hypothetical protein [Burkholderiales bacterium]